MDLLSLFAGEFNIPVIEDEQKVWFFRTKAGQFYHDFRTNNFIGLGWELVSCEMIIDQSASYDSKKKKIEDLYPDEKRPGLILGQMDTFYNKMQINDLVVIPSYGGRQITIGKIGPFVNDINHAFQPDEYQKCDYSHKRSVEWLKTVESWQDIYLFKALRAQQTISDITEEAKLVFRNLFPVYMSSEAVHISFHKESQSELSLANNVDLQAGLLDIMDEIAKLYGMESFRENVSIKTAVGSPGFIEMILPHIPVAGISVGLIVTILLGKAKGEDGTVASGISAFLTTVNNLLNDYHNRKKTDAEVKQIEANIRLTDAQADREKAEAEKLKAEAELLTAQAKKTTSEIPTKEEKYEQVFITSSGKTNVQEAEEQERLTVAGDTEVQTAVCQLQRCAGKVCTAASKCGLTYNGEKIQNAV